jgi:hypothetical protein
MTRVVCPLCHTGFEVGISRDNFAINCVACGVAFSAASFLSREDFAAPKTEQRAATATSVPVGINGRRPATGAFMPAAPTTRTGALPFIAPTDTKSVPAAATPESKTAAEQKPVHELRERLREIRAKLQEQKAERSAVAAAEKAITSAPVAEAASAKAVSEPVAAAEAPQPQPVATAVEAKDQPSRAEPRGTTASTSKSGNTSKKTTRRPLLEGTFGPFDIEGEIARGGVGAVFRAKERATGRQIALKVLIEGAEAGDAERERFQRECETAKALSLPGMVQVYMVGEHDGRPYMAMELVNGRSLDKVIAEKSLSVNDCLVLMKSVAETIGALHEAGYVHRDVKPGNILIDSFGSPKVADFGLVKSLDEITRLTASGLVCGTPAYMAPEQARGDGKAIDPRSDVWALGAVLYEMLTSHPPFRAENALRLMLKITKDQPIPPRQLNLKVPQDVHYIVMKCLEKSPEKRYANAREMAGDITRFLNGEPLSPNAQPPMQQLWARASQNRRGLIAMAGGIAAVIVVAVLARIVFAPREAKPLVERGYRVLSDRTLTDAQRLDMAEKCFREAMALDAKYGKAYLGVGLCLGRRAIDYQNQRIVDTRKLSEAMAATNQAAELDPALRAERYAQVARFNMWLKQHVDEARELEQAVECASGNLKYREALAMAYWNAGAQTNSSEYLKRAVREYQAILHDDPTYPKVRDYIRTLQERFLAQPANLSMNTKK